MVKSGGNIPALRSVAEMPVFTEFGPANTKIFYESLDVAQTVPSPQNFNVIDPILNRHYQTIWNGEKTVEEALAAARRRAPGGDGQAEARVSNANVPGRRPLAVATSPGHVGHCNTKGGRT